MNEGQLATTRRLGLVTLPALMHDVHTDSRLGAPLTIARTRWMLGFQRRLLRLWEWLTLMPNEGCLPQTSHTDAIGAEVTPRPGRPEPPGDTSAAAAVSVTMPG